LERVVDFSIQLELQTADLKLLGYTGLYNDWKGQYRGNWAWPGFNRQMCVHLPRLFPHVPDVTKQVLELYSRIVSLLEQKLRNYDYLGPIGVDAFVYRTSAGEHRIKPIVEVNPRYTMGRLTLELMKNVAPGSSGTLRLITPKMIKEEGFSSFSSWARAARQKWPVIREGEPVGRIREGMICLNDSNDAQVCLAVFHVSRGRSG
jgi:hypothetical protein